ncbi:MAG: META domain-containing protein [Anaerolineae bacterium]
MNLQTALLSGFLLLISVITVGCEAESQRDSIRKSDLVGSRWVLSKLVYNNEVISIERNPEISLEFRSGQIGGLSGCNNYQASWKLGRDGQFALGGPISQTRQGCLDAVMLAERNFIAVLEQAHTLILANDLLIIDSKLGQLTFVKGK